MHGAGKETEKGDWENKEGETNEVNCYMQSKWTHGE